MHRPVAIRPNHANANLPVPAPVFPAGLGERTAPHQQLFGKPAQSPILEQTSWVREFRYGALQTKQFKELVVQIQLERRKDSREHKANHKRAAEQMEAAHKVALAKAEVGIRERKVFPTLSEFADQDFLPFVQSRFANNPKTLEYYKTGLEEFTLYTLRHTCLTRWSAHMDPYTLAYLAGHSDFSTTKRYVHPQADKVRAAMERARGARGAYQPKSG